MCPSCKQRIIKQADHEFCHINFAKGKTYEDYAADASSTNQSIIEKYGAPPEAKPPSFTSFPTNDSQIRAMLLGKRDNG